MPKITFAEKIIREVINDPQATTLRIREGQDGDKFKIITSKGEVLFGRVKKENKSQELPYQEAIILNKVNSQYIIKPIRVDRIKGYYIIIRPFIEGITLEEHLRSGALELDEVKKLAKTLISCVESLLLVGAVHFDIKPANIIVGTDGNFYLIDFGAAKFLKKMKTERIHPARRYIAPEVLKYLFEPSELALHQLSSLSDMYGVGGVLYYAVTGHNISDFFNSSSEILQKVPFPVRYFKPSFDSTIAEMVDQLLTKEPSRRIRPDDAKALLEGKSLPAKSVPLYFLKTKPGRGSEHKQMLSAIIQGGDLTGIYWFSNNSPSLPKKVASHNVIWETPFRDNQKIFQNDLLRQYKQGVLALCVPGEELENAADARTLHKNLNLIDIAINWKRKIATHIPILAVVSIDEALLTSAEINSIQNAYASKTIDGIILRICTPANMSFDVRHLKSVKKFIYPWAKEKRAILFDGDMSAFPLSLFGVSGLISTTYPKLNILSRRKIRPSFSRKPDGMYIRKFLGIISADSVRSLRGSKFGKAITNCSCPFCSSTLMHPTKWSNIWVRPERRKHFIFTVAEEIKSIKNSPPGNLKERILQAQRETARFSQYIDINLPHLQTWLNFLNSENL